MVLATQRLVFKLSLITPSAAATWLSATMRSLTARATITLPWASMPAVPLPQAIILSVSARSARTWTIVALSATSIPTCSPLLGPIRIVTITSSGRLGRGNVSSRRYKHDFKSMEKASEALYALKPVSFRYNKEYDATQALAFG